MYQLLEKLFVDATRLTQSVQLTEVPAALQRALESVAGADGARPAAAMGVVLDTPRIGFSTAAPAMPLRGGPDVPAARTPVRRSARPAGMSAPGAPRATFAEGSFTGRTETRTYKLFVPAAAVDRGPPLIVMLHGCSQSPDDFATGTRMNEIAQERGFLVLYPAQAPRSNGSRCWNWFLPGDQRRGSGEPEVLAAMTRDVMTRHGVDPNRVYIAGLSAGGAMADIMGREYPDLYAAVGVHSGVPQGAAHDASSAFTVMRNGAASNGSQAGAPGGPTTLRRRSKGVRLGTRQAAAIVFHGDRDDTVHPSNGEEVIGALLQAAGGTARIAATTEKASNAGRAVTRTVHRRAPATPEEPSLAEHWIVHGAGHAWSGGSTRGSFTDAAGPDATREMVRFFEEHPLRPA